MKKNSIFIMSLLLLLSFTACNKNTPNEPKFVDLGLPSGTLWKSEPESGFFSFDDAITKFNNMVPTQDQWNELKEECKVELIEGTAKYKCTGPNGESIILYGSGRIHCDGIRNFGTHGYFWTSTSLSEDEAMSVDFDEGQSLRFNEDLKCAQLSIRLVK